MSTSVADTLFVAGIHSILTRRRAIRERRAPSIRKGIFSVASNESICNCKLQ